MVLAEGKLAYPDSVRVAWRTLVIDSWVGAGAVVVVDKVVCEDCCGMRGPIRVTVATRALLEGSSMVIVEVVRSLSCCWPRVAGSSASIGASRSVVLMIAARLAAV